jgi:predicted ATPase/DNA-binding SARP family transcriptional activator
MSLQPCSINMFGDLRIEAMGAAVTQFRTRKIAALLGTLAYHTDRMFRRDELVEMIWPDTNPESGRNRLRIALCGLRQDLDGVCTDDTLLQADRIHVKLDANGFRTDRDEFESCLRRADTLTDVAERHALLNRALSLYTGELLPGYEETWIIGERARLRNLYQRALRDLVRNRVEAERIAEALAYAERWAQFDPLDEEAHRIVMRMLVGLKRPGDALRQYALLERLLREQLGIGPSARSRELADECHRNNPISARPAALLADLAAEPSPQEERIKPSPAVTISDIPVQPLPATPPPAHRAPELTFPLFGRDAAIAAVSALLTEPQARLVTLTGPGGIGKTCLALAVAAQMRDQFADGVCFVPLADLANAALIPESVATALGLRDMEPETCLAEIAAYAQGRSLALLLDNFEHLAEGGAPVLQTLLSRAPGIRALTTSRQRLRLTGEAEFAVSPLPSPEPDASLEGLAACASVQMFLDRARRIHSGFRLDADNAAAIAAICRALDGMPLGIELVASWTQLLTPAQIRARFQDRFIDVTSRSRTTPDRHRSLRRVVESSCELLPAEATRLFATLSVFRGTFTLAAVEAVTPPATADLYEALAELLDQSLLVCHEGDREHRFALLEPLRQVAATLLTADETDEAARRHAGYYCRFAEAADAKLRGPETALGLHALDAESPNIRAALDRFATSPELGLPLASALRRYWRLRGRYREGLEWLERALAHDGTGSSELRSRALRGAGNLALYIAEFEVAGAFYREALALAIAAADLPAIASTLNNLGSVADGQGDRAQAQALYEESLQRYRELADRRGIALILSNLAALHANSGNLDAAFALHTQCIAEFRELGAVDSLILALGNLANVECRRGHLEEARTALHECLPLVRQLGTRVELATWLEVCALLAICRGEMSRAALVWGRSQAVFLEQRFAPVGDDICVKPGALDQMRAALGEPGFDEAVQRGRAMTDDEAVELALPNPPAP